MKGVFIVTETITKEKALSVIEQYVEQKKSKKETFNLFEIIQMRETSHTKFLAWLLNVKNKSKNSLQFQFMKKFLKKINIEAENLDDFVKLLSEDMFIKTEYPTGSGNIDIFIYSKKANFVCIIENKIDAKICIGKNGKSQIERYYNFVNSKVEFESCKQEFVFITGYSEILRKSDLELLNNHQYQIIEQSDIAEIIDDETISSCTNNIVKEIVKQYKDYWEHNWYDTIDGIWIGKACNIVRNEYSNSDLQNFSSEIRDVLSEMLDQ